MCLPIITKNIKITFKGKLRSAEGSLLSQEEWPWSSFTSFFSFSLSFLFQVIIYDSWSIISFVLKILCSFGRNIKCFRYGDIEGSANNAHMTMAAKVATAGGRDEKTGGRSEWLYVAGECAKLPLCNKYCVSNGFRLGGFCKKLSPQAASLSCVCKYT